MVHTFFSFLVLPCASSCRLVYFSSMSKRSCCCDTETDQILTEPISVCLKVKRLQNPNLPYCLVSHLFLLQLLPQLLSSPATFLQVAVGLLQKPLLLLSFGQQIHAANNHLLLQGRQLIQQKVMLLSGRYIRSKAASPLRKFPTDDVASINSLGFEQILLPLFQLCPCLVPLLLLHVQFGLQGLPLLLDLCLHLHHLVCRNLLLPFDTKTTEDFYFVLLTRGSELPPNHMFVSAMAWELKIKLSLFYAEGCVGWGWGEGGLNSISISMRDFDLTFEN